MILELHSIADCKSYDDMVINYFNTLIQQYPTEILPYHPIGDTTLTCYDLVVKINDIHDLMKIAKLINCTLMLDPSYEHTNDKILLDIYDDYIE